MSDGIILMNKRTLLYIGLTISLLACNFPSSTPRSNLDLLATLQASTPGAVFTPAPVPLGTPASTEPTGKIVMTCQIFKELAKEQICIVNADGSGYRRLTSEDDVRHYYPSVAPDGQSVVYSAYSEKTKRYEIFEFDLAANAASALTSAFGDMNAPDISPDGTTIVFTRFDTDPDKPTTWLMARDGTDLRQVADVTAWDPTWSPDGSRILFASYAGGITQLFIVNIDGTGLRQVGDFPFLRGRSDWSLQDLIVTYSGKTWEREIYIMNSDGSAQQEISPIGGNSQGPSFSPDGQWIAFTSYFDRYEVHGCEIYIMRVDGTDLRRLTDNDYCDYQPRWGP
jgi:Tol biopolymer transport system component